MVVWIAAFATLAMALLLRRTVFGRYVYAIGSNASAAAKSGVNVRLYTMLVYTVSGLSAAIGAVVLTAWVGSAQPIAAPNITLESLAAVVLGVVVARATAVPTHQATVQPPKPAPRRSGRI
mgnify:CR=1 FL=1